MNRRRWIFAAIDVVLAIAYAYAIVKVIPNRYLASTIHLWTLPIAMAALAIGLVVGKSRGWWIAIAGGSLLLLSAFVLIVRIVASAAFLAGVYGAFGKAASLFALMTAAIVVEIVVLIPLFQVRYLMSRAGRRTFGRA